ncbi:MAG: DNA polymerase III subunit delta, partial [Bacteroidales bacterium]|nr:DNA polymerase III subunit delta [Bacteroidales bacterium]
MAKAAATFEGIMSDLKAKKYLPVYFLQGDEPYFIDKIASYIEENVLNETEKIFNQSVVYGKDVDVRSVDALAKSFPAMAQNRVVIVKEAQDLKKIEDLVFYAEKPLKSTLLVICYKY